VENLLVNAQDGYPRNNHRREKDKGYVSVGEWRMIMSAINHGIGIPADLRREVLMGYQYALHQHKKKLLQEKSKLRRSHKSNSELSTLQWEEYSETSESSEERHRELKHNRRRIGWSGKASRNSYVAADEEENIYARHARGSPGSSASIPVNHTARTQRSTGKHASSRHKKPRADWR
jgi:hypothetical protein